MADLILEVQTGDARSTLEFSQDEVIIGRGAGETAPDVVLHDAAASRKHARIWRALDGYWIEDLCSMHGTTKKGVPLMGPARIFSGDHFQVGDSCLTIQRANILDAGVDLDELFGVYLRDKLDVNDMGEESAPAARIKVVAQKEVFTANRGDESDDKLNEPRGWSWHDHTDVTNASEGVAVDNMIGMFGEMINIFSREQSLEECLKHAAEAIVTSVDSVERGVILLLNEDHTQLIVSGHYPSFKPAFSSTLAIKALTGGEAFIWKSASSEISSTSIKKLNIKSGLYAPLTFGPYRKLGVCCVDTTSSNMEIAENDLPLFVGLSHVLSPLIFCKQLQEKLNS